MHIDNCCFWSRYTADYRSVRKVTDSQGKAIPNAVVRSEGTEVSPVITDTQGRYKFFLVGQKARFTLHVSKEGYNSEVSSPLTPSKAVSYDAVFKTGDGITIIREKFITGTLMSGKIQGIPAGQSSQYKVLVYILTDKWWIHPYAENTERRGYANIKEDGSWEIQTVNRGHNPFKLALLVVSFSTTPPSSIVIEGEPEASLRAKFGSNLKGLLIIDNPEGL